MYHLVTGTKPVKLKLRGVGIAGNDTVIPMLSNNGKVVTFYKYEPRNRNLTLCRDTPDIVRPFNLTDTKGSKVTYSTEGNYTITSDKNKVSRYDVISDIGIRTVLRHVLNEDIIKPVTGTDGFIYGMIMLNGTLCVVKSNVSTTEIIYRVGSKASNPYDCELISYSTGIYFWDPREMDLVNITNKGMVRKTWFNPIKASTKFSYRFFNTHGDNLVAVTVDLNTNETKLYHVNTEVGSFMRLNISGSELNDCAAILRARNGGIIFITKNNDIRVLERF